MKVNVTHINGSSSPRLDIFLFGTVARYNYYISTYYTDLAILLINVLYIFTWPLSCTSHNYGVGFCPHRMELSTLYGEYSSSTSVDVVAGNTLE